MGSVARIVVITLVLVAVGIGLWRYQRHTEVARHQRAQILDSGHLATRHAALTPSGTVWEWRIRNKPGTQAHEVADVRELSGLKGVTSVSVGACSILAIRGDGSVWGQGCNAAGQLGPMANDDRGVIKQWTQAAGLPKMRRVVATGVTAAAVAEDGSVWAWGSNHDGFMGQKIDERFLRRPVRLEGLSDITDITAGGGYSGGSGDGFYAVKRDGTVWVWGRRYLFDLPHVSGQSDSIPYAIPVRIEYLSDVLKVVVDRTGGMPALAIHADGRVTLWGRYFNWCDDRPGPPYEIPGLKDVTSAAIGVMTVLAVRRDGSLWHWGWTDPTPQAPSRCMATAEQLLPPGSAREVAASGTMKMVLFQDGTVRIWGLERGKTDLTHWAERTAIAQLPGL